MILKIIATTTTGTTMDLTDYVELDSIVLEKRVTREPQILEFTIRKNAGTNLFIPTFGNKITLATYNNVGNIITPLFKGIVLERQLDSETPLIDLYKIVCKDDKYLLDSRLVQQQFFNTNLLNVIENIVQGLLPVAVDNGTTPIDSISFNYINVSNCLQKLTDLLTEYDYYIDLSVVNNTIVSTLYFKRGTNNYTSYQITDTSNNYIKETLNLKEDGSQLRNVVVVKGGGNDVYPITNTLVADGVATILNATAEMTNISWQRAIYIFIDFRTITTSGGLFLNNVVATYSNVNGIQLSNFGVLSSAYTSSSFLSYQNDFDVMWEGSINLGTDDGSGIGFSDSNNNSTNSNGVCVNRGRGNFFAITITNVGVRTFYYTTKAYDTNNHIFRLSRKSGIITIIIDGQDVTPSGIPIFNSTSSYFTLFSIGATITSANIKYIYNHQFSPLNVGSFGIDTIPPRDALYNYLSGQLSFTTPPTLNTQIKYTGSIAVPIIAIAENSESIEKYQLRVEYLITDNTILTLAEAVKKAQAEIIKYTESPKIITFTTYDTDEQYTDNFLNLKLADYIYVNILKDGIEGYYKVSNIKYESRRPNNTDLTSKRNFTIYFEVVSTIPTKMVDIFNRLLNKDKETKIEDGVIIDKIETPDELIKIVETWQIMKLTDFRLLTALPAGWVRTQANGTLTFNATTGLVLTNTGNGFNILESNQDGSAFQTGAGAFTATFVGTLSRTLFSSHLFVLYNQTKTNNIWIGRLSTPNNWIVSTPTGSVNTTFAADSNEHTFKIQRLVNGNIQYYVDTTLIYTYTGVDTINYSIFQYWLYDAGTQYLKSFSI